jgi:hypothetical protein
MLVDVLADADVLVDAVVLIDATRTSAYGLPATRDTFPTARLTYPSNTGLRPPRTPTPAACARTADTALQGPPIGR